MGFSLVSLAQGPQVIDRVIATVGGELLLLSELQEQLSLMETQGGQKPSDKERCMVVEQLLTAKLLVNQAKLDSIEVGEEEVEAGLDARFDRILTMMNNDLKQFEEYYGQTVSEVKTAFRDDLRSQLLSERMRSQIVANARMTPAEVKAFFGEIPTDSLPYFSSEVEIRELTMKPAINDVQRQDALDRVEALRTSILDGSADFAEMARKYSEDPGSGRAGGDLGWAPRGTFVPNFEAAAYRLDVGEVSDVIETQFGFHLIELQERRGNRIRSRHILIKPKIVQADLDRTVALMDSIRTLMTVDSMPFREGVRLFGFEKAQSYSNGGRMTNPGTGNTFFEISDLDPFVFLAIDTLETGGITSPVKFEQPGGGEIVFKLIMLESRSKPHKASLQTDYDKIRKAAIESKKSVILSDWVEKTIGATFIKMDRSLVRDCNLEGRWFLSGTASRP
ncbi:MAG: peptidylprolyl isomerase [Saprospiraceae bacterium]